MASVSSAQVIPTAGTVAGFRLMRGYDHVCGFFCSAGVLVVENVVLRGSACMQRQIIPRTLYPKLVD